MVDKILAWLGKQILPPLEQAIISTVQKTIADWMPKIIEAVVTAVAQSAGQLTVDTVDQVTNVIPGNLDDQIIDGLVGDILGRLGWRN